MAENKQDDKNVQQQQQQGGTATRERMMVPKLGDKVEFHDQGRSAIGFVTKIDSDGRCYITALWYDQPPTNEKFVEYNVDKQGRGWRPL